ncbi:MAG: fumarylacetoacetate hydrolase family protein [Gemmatimonadota bacterium]|nr:fumarylacetoacetate hydrolase family protein [Gemmatimonadota bacterium]
MKHYRSPSFLGSVTLGALAVASALSSCAPGETSAQDAVTHFVRFEIDGRQAAGVVDDQGRITEIDGDMTGSYTLTNRVHDQASVAFLPPTNPSKVIAVGLNYRSHLGEREPLEYPGLFAKFPSSLAGHGATIPMPADANNLHYEGEMVLVMGRRAKNVPASEALEYVFGVTAGNDVSERDWQDQDLQWFRAKASDGFGPVGPYVAVGLDPDDLLLTTRVNGEVRQQESTADLLFDVSTIISYISRYVTLEPGDLVFTGTPGSTQAMSPGDVVEVELEGVGVLSNTVGRRPST